MFTNLKLDELKSNLLIANFIITSIFSTIGRYLISKQPLLAQKNQKPLQVYCTE